MIKQAIQHFSARLTPESRQTPDGVALPVQIAALPWRRNADSGKPEVLLITSRTSGRWIIPKGWPMWRKKDWEAAAIEAFEEAGVEGMIEKEPIGSFQHDKKRVSALPIRFLINVYPLQVVRCLEEWPERSERQRKWLPLEDAAQLVCADGLRQILKQFRG
jgi:8-oxo-dGTP pyrophosphatase MutT (NUDIX family)